jgi:general stress protein YciG
MQLTPEERAILSKLGRAGGPARAKKLSPERRSEIARMGGLASQANGRRKGMKYKRNAEATNEESAA